MTRREFLDASLRCAAGGGALLLAAAGCRTPHTPLAVEIGFDITPPDVENRAKLASQFVRFVRPGDTVTLRALDRNTTILTTALPRSDRDAERVLMDAAGRMTPVTDLPRYFERVAPALERAALPSLLVVYSDTQTDACLPTECEQRVRAVAKRLARLAGLRAVVLVGAVRESRKDWTGLAEMLQAGGIDPIVFPREMVDPAQVTRAIRAFRTGGTVAGGRKG